MILTQKAKNMIRTLMTSRNAQDVRGLLGTNTGALAGLLALVVVLLAGCAHRVADSVLPITSEELAGKWAGHDSTGQTMYLLVLGSNGRGLFGMLYNGGRPHAYFVNHWAVARNHITIQLEPTSRSLDHITVAAETQGGVNIVLSVRGHDWQQRAILLREEELEKKLKVLNESLRTIRSGVAH